jgi:hypothetical protein
VSRASAALHLIDLEGPAASRWLGAVAREHARMPRICLGARPCPHAVARIPLPAGRTALAARALERLVEAMDALEIVAWGARAAEVAVRAVDTAARTLVLDVPPASCRVAFDAEIVCVSDASADRVCAAGWPPMRIRVLQPSAPWIAEADGYGERARAWRSTRGVDPGAFVIGLLPSGPEMGDAWSALHAVGRVRMAGVDAVLVLDPRTAGSAAADVFARSIGMRGAVLFEDLSTELDSLACAVDAWISVPGGRLDGTALDPMIAAGTFAPLVAASGSIAASVIERGVDGIVADAPNAMAATLLELAEWPERRRRIATAARVRHAASVRRQAFAALIQEIEARASMRAASASAASA